MTSLFIFLFLSIPTTVVVIYLYLRSSFLLLELVQQDEGLWEALNKPQKIWIKQHQGSFHTIQPIGPWLVWVWGAKTSSTNPQLIHSLQKTGGLLKASLASFVLTTTAILMLVLSTT